MACSCCFFQRNVCIAGAAGALTFVNNARGFRPDPPLAQGDGSAATPEGE
jgi:hypothetical protein